MLVLILVSKAIFLIGLVLIFKLHLRRIRGAGATIYYFLTLQLIFWLHKSCLSRTAVRATISLPISERLPEFVVSSLWVIFNLYLTED
jgi:hypothetical protein